MPDVEDLARRAVASAKFRWMPGMLAFPTAGCTPVPVRLTDDRRPNYPDEYAWPHDMGLRFPDLTDAATLGCLLQLVREAWGDDRAYLCDFEGYDSVEWGVVSKIWDEKRNEEGPKAWFSCLLGDGKTEAEALVCALENGP